MTEWQKITQSQDGMKEGWKITWYPKRGIILRRDMGAISHAIYSSLSRILGDFPPLHHFVIPSFHHSTIPPFYHSTIPPFHNSTFPPFHHSTIPFFDHSTIPGHPVFCLSQAIIFCKTILQIDVFFPCLALLMSHLKPYLSLFHI